jgi:hypothetical protein
MTTHWLEWHAQYEDPSNRLNRRLAAVQAGITEWLASAPPGPLRAISVCSGQGRDLIGALDGHPRAHDVRALMVELDEGNVAVARALAEEAGLSGVTTEVGDASLTEVYAGAVPAELVLVCGVFGNISDGDIERTIALLPGLCAPGATVVWTRHRRPPDKTPVIREWFAAAGFEEQWFVAPDDDDAVFAVGMHRLVADPAPFEPGVRLFEFVGDGALPA